ncbi:MAG: hypothetical protein Q9191_005399, partial [Dirinaria sp. TL-2023a]
MIQVLERDWEARWIAVEQSGNKEDLTPLRQSMIVHYLSADTLTTGHERKVLRAIFADATTRSMTEFPEIWRNETKERKRDSSDAKRTESKMDIEADNYGDYMASSSSDLEEEEEESPEGAASSPHLMSPPASDGIPNGAALLGGLQAITLRLRLLSLLATLSAVLPTAFLPLRSLYEHFHSLIRPLPLPTFFTFLSPLALSGSMTAAASSTLTQYMLRSLIASAAPVPPDDNLEQKMLERYYLPFPANTLAVADNAK